MTDDPPDGLGRSKLSQAKRIDLLERDRAQQSRMITGLVEQVQKGFTAEQMQQLRSAFREELADVGLRIDDPDHIDDAREDFRFLRRVRQSYDGAARKIGGAVLAAFIVIAGAIIASGFWAWISSGGKPPV